MSSGGGKPRRTAFVLRSGPSTATRSITPRALAASRPPLSVEGDFQTGMFTGDSVFYDPFADPDVPSRTNGRVQATGLAFKQKTKPRNRQREEVARRAAMEQVARDLEVLAALHAGHSEE
jgi:hypothetical protein